MATVWVLHGAKFSSPETKLNIGIPFVSYPKTKLNQGDQEGTVYIQMHGILTLSSEEVQHLQNTQVWSQTWETQHSQIGH